MEGKWGSINLDLSLPTVRVSGSASAKFTQPGFITSTLHGSFSAIDSSPPHQGLLNSWY